MNRFQSYLSHLIRITRSKSVLNSTFSPCAIGGALLHPVNSATRENIELEKKRKEKKINKKKGKLRKDFCWTLTN